MTKQVRVTRGIWRPADQVGDFEGRCGALLTAAPDGAVLAGVTAARMHGLWLPDHEPEQRIELVLRRDDARPQQWAHSIRPELRGRRRRLQQDEVSMIGGLPVTALARTWVDLAERLVLEDLVAAGDSALRSGASVTDLDRAIGRAVHRRGVVLARRCLPLLDRGSRSRPESWLRVGLIIRGLPEPAVNRAVHDSRGQWLAEPDLSYGDVRLALEYNGAVHASTDRMRRDITREVDLMARGGWRTLTLGPAQVFRRMDETAALVRELRRQARPQR